MNLVVLGAPGAGKGTQARNLAVHYGIAHISTGDILRDNIRKRTELGMQMEEIMKEGRLAPDNVAVDLITEALKDVGSNGFVLDGFPRTLYQAEALGQLTQITKAISVEVGDGIIVERMSGRLTCPMCGAMFHSHYHPPKAIGICNNCQTALVQREDDKVKTVQNRLAIYHQLTEPIVQYYKGKNLLLEVDGVGDINEITDFIVRSLGEANGYIHKNG